MNADEGHTGPGAGAPSRDETPRGAEFPPDGGSAPGAETPRVEARPRPAAEGAARRGRRPDPWAHRRGEPRLFAFLWTVFLFTATGLTFMTAVSMGGTSPDVMRPATRILLAVTALGVTLLWPVVRLSQAADDHPVAGVVQDLVVVLIPAQAVIWPQSLGWLGRWPLSVVTAAACLIVAWGLLVGGILAVAQVRHRRAEAGYGRWSPTLWALVFIVLVVGGSVPAMFSRGVGPNEPDRRTVAFQSAWMWSPVTGLYEVTRDRSWSGTSAAVTAGHWRAIGLTALAAAPAWVLAAAQGRGMRARRRLH